MSRTFRLGAFIVATLLILAAGVFWIGGKQFMFNSTYRLNADFQTAAGLPNGADVRVGGIHEGTVARIQLPRGPNDKVRVVMDLKKVTQNVIKNDSLATIRSEGLVGDKYVEITFGSDSAPKVKNGDLIQGEPPLEFSDLMKKTNGLLDSASDAMQNVVTTSEDLKSVTSKINQGTGTMGALINDKSLYQRINAGAAAMQEDLEALKHNFLLRGFFNRRGYKDSADLTKHQLPRLPAVAVSKNFTYEAAKLFDKADTAKLKNAKALNEAGQFLETNTFGLAVVTVYTDMKGDTEKNRLLTEARAMVVRDYLVQNFKLDDTRIKTIGQGKSADTNARGGGVEILVYPAGTNSPDTQRALSSKR
jgi:phospholipid/cholesterol/gamma-HCH transport system substrate-binding protein